MGVSLYTSRIVLNVLGVEDFGIYNVVGGIVTMFSFINSAMTAATQRFLAFEIGKGDKKMLAKVFSNSIIIHALIAILILILAETVGIWFFNNKMNIPDDRFNAAQWVYQLSVVSSMVMIMSVPYNALIIAHERMKAFAYISIIEVILKLGIVFLLIFFTVDKLKLYAALHLAISIINRFIYNTYSIKNFSEAKFKFIWDKKLFLQMANFASWGLLGSLANVGKTNGINIIMNIFCGVVVNAAMGIANQVNTALNSFVSNFQMAFNPQIVKTYASGNHIYLMQLINNTSRLAFLLLYFLSLPVLLFTEQILNLWLNVVPDNTIIFTRLIIIYSLIESLSGPLWITMQATGRIRNYQIVISLALLLNIPATYILLKNHLPAYYSLIAMIFISVIAFLIRLIFVNKYTKLNVKLFIKNVLLKIFSVLLISMPLFIINWPFSNIGLGIFLKAIIVVILNAIIIYFIGLKSNERSFIIEKANSFFNSIKTTR